MRSEHRSVLANDTKDDTTINGTNIVEYKRARARKEKLFANE